MATSSQRKGSDYERALADHINKATGLKTAHRAPLSGGGKVGMAGGADILGTPDLFIEAKRTERLNVREALRQAETNVSKTNAPERPVVITRRNREAMGDSLVVMRLDDFLSVYRSHLLHTGVPTDDGRDDGRDEGLHILQADEAPI